jgi:acetylornithine deacetylase
LPQREAFVLADPATTARILAAVEARQERIVAMMREIVRVESVTGNEASAQHYVAGLLRELGMRVDVFEPDLAELRGHPGYWAQPGLDFAGRPNVVGVLEGDPAARSLVLNGHIDTIPLGPDEAWTEAGPLSGALKDGEVYGRGSSDMKCGLVMFVAALQALLESGLKPRGKVILQSVVDEEVSGLGTLACVQRGYTADAGICGETSDMQVMPACIGRLWFKVLVRGRSAGIATRWLAVDAIQKAIKISNAFEDLQQIRLDTLTHPLYPDNRMALPCSVNMISAGSYPSATPEAAVLQGSLGTMPYEDLEDVKEQVRRQVALVSQADPWLREHLPEVVFDGYTAVGAEIPQDHPIVRTVAAAYETALKRRPTYGGRTGAADTRFLIRYGNTPTVIFGPGVTAKMHMSNESVPVRSLTDAVKVTALAIHDWCGQDR